MLPGIILYEFTEHSAVVFGGVADAPAEDVKIPSTQGLKLSSSLGTSGIFGSSSSSSEREREAGLLTGPAMREPAPQCGTFLRSAPNPAAVAAAAAASINESQYLAAAAAGCVAMATGRQPGISRAAESALEQGAIV